MTDASTLEARAQPAIAGVVAIDVGGTDMKTALLTPAGELVDIARIPTPQGEGAAGAIVERLAETIESTRARHPDVSIGAVGIGVPGLVDDVRGIARFASNLTWSDFPFRAVAEQRTGLPVAFGHDVRAAGLAERELGAARGFANVAVMVIGTGIACTLVVDGLTLLSDGFAGEIGHAIVDPGGDICSCGGRGHLEVIGSASAIARRYTSATGIRVAGAREVLDRARAGDAAAAGVWADGVEALSIGLSHIVAMTGPEVIVIGGGLAQAGDELFLPLEEALARRLTFQRRPRLVRAHLGENAGLLGSALAARHLIGQ